MWEVIHSLCTRTEFLALMFLVIFVILGYLFRYKISKEVYDTEMNSIKEHFEDQKIDLARIERRLWDLATGNLQMPLDPEVIKNSNNKKKEEL